MIESQSPNNLTLPSLFYHNAILNTMQRSYSTANCDCAPMPLYFDGRISFWCQEDYMLNPQECLSVLDTIVKNSGDSLMMAYLETVAHQERVPFLNVFNSAIPSGNFMQSVEARYSQLLSDPETTDSSNCWFGLGSDWGCCGNYSGCCWYWSTFCYWHDVHCAMCEHWDCTPLCQPDA